DVRIILNSYGGSCNAATQMYDELKAYPGNVHIIVSGTAASAATVLAMAANRLEMTPGSLFMCHDPIMGAYGNEADLEQAMGILRACKNSIINMYCQRTWHSRDDVAAMMRATTWMDANAALQEGFIDAVMTEPAAGVTNAAFEHRVDPEDAKAKFQSWVDRHKPMRRSVRNEAPQAAPTEPRTSASDLQGRLDRLKYTY
ncbi:MAG: head maturation protease, ClpP-related, partial [Aristaeellaceae bacterium]